jgi:uncharacterized membrane protein
MERGKTVSRVYILTLVGTVLWLAAVWAAPLLKARSFRGAAFLYAVFSPVCHQRPDRSFFVAGFPLAVCGRCLGIYLGFLAGVLVYPLLGRRFRTGVPGIRLLVAVTLPIGLDAVGNFLGLWGTGNVVRLATGFVWGGLLPFFFIPGVAEACLQRASRIHRMGGHPEREEAP